MIVLRLVRRPDGVLAGPSERTLAAAGSTIGRAPDCDLVLDDPLRLVSRRHAWIVPRGDDAAMVRCISASAALLVNGEALDPGGERVVRIGDRIRIGGFEVLLDGGEPETLISAPTALVPSAVAPAPAPPSPPPSPPLAPLPPPPVVAPPVVAPAPDQAAVAAPAMPRRLDRWFNLETVPDPLGPASPLPAADEAEVAQAARPIARPPATPLAAPAATPVAMPSPIGPAPPWRGPGASAEPLAARLAASLAPAVAAKASASEADAMRQAFLRGAGLDPALPLELDPPWMEHLGALLRISTEGTVDLLRSRAVAKRGLRSEGTRIAARENNLLKFTPDAAEALRFLLSRETRPGFLGATEALRDAQEDLQLHQLALVAGMRAALFDLISRLGPDAVEREEGPAQGLAKWSALWREAALWRRHRHGHARLLENLDDTFEAIFGREFVRAYEAQARRVPPGESDLTS